MMCIRNTIRPTYPAQNPMINWQTRFSSLAFQASDGVTRATAATMCRSILFLRRWRWHPQKPWKTAVSEPCAGPMF